jgi:quercetin dioxygenase-like cupin family protein
VNDLPVLDLRSIFGVYAKISKSADATDGAFVEMDCTAEPGSGTMVHFHPEQEETFTVLEGELEVLREGQWTPVLAGESYSVPKGAVHAWRNAAQVPARFVNVHRPALGFEDHMRTLDRLVREGRIRGKSDPRSIIYMSLSAVEHRPDVTVKPPQWLVNAAASVGRLLGFSLEAQDRRNSA